jgi:hypothetical protein
MAGIAFSKATATINELAGVAGINSFVTFVARYNRTQPLELTCSAGVDAVGSSSLAA